jgi:predicted aminopeptidase
MDLTFGRRPAGHRLRRSRRDLLALLKYGALSCALIFSLTGCQLSYYMHSAYNQSKLVQSRQPIKKVVNSQKTKPEVRRKLQLVQDVKAFAESDLGLKKSSNYTSYVELDEPYVTYIVQAARKFELKPYLWKFPFVGEVPYKGYFKRKLADREAAQFNKDEFDTFVRGVTAYSTLGWFQDSVLSSMMRYEDHDLVETIIHETVHTTLFIKNAAEFNERMATFLGHEGMKMYYRKKDGPKSIHLIKAEDDTFDQHAFSAFITKELADLKKWYEDNKGQVTAESKAKRLKEIQERFTKDLKPKLKTDNYFEFEKRELNNAYLLAIQTYEYSLEDFQKLWEKNGGDFHKTLEYLKTLEKTEDPASELKKFVSS